MALPIEIRNLVRPITLEEIAAGVQPIKQNGRLYHPPILQYRVREKAGWSEWVAVAFEREE